MQSKSDFHTGYSTLFLQYYPEMLRYSLQILKNYEDAEDSVQNAFLNLLQKGNSFDEERSFEPWFRQIVYHCSIDCWRRRMKIVEIRGVLDDSTPSTARSPDEIAELAEMQEKIQAAIMTLPKNIRDTIELYYFKQCSGTEISEMFSIPPSTVHARLHRGRKLIKAAVAQEP